MSERNRAIPFAWIPVAEELPDDEQLVLIALDDGEVWTGFMDAGVWLYVTGDEMSATVTHWAHLPPAPNTERKVA